MAGSPSKSRASGSRPAGPLRSPTTPNKLNDHIYELYKPPSGEPSMDILFFHGLQLGDSTNAYWSTWICGDDSGKIWPSTWLVEEFPNAHIFSISYDACMTTTGHQGRFDLCMMAENLIQACCPTWQQGRFDLFMVAENLIQAICWADIGQRPVVLVGHSFGGLVMKELCVRADQTRCSEPPESDNTRKIRMFLDNIAGLFYYGTPHHGSHLANFASHFLTGPLLVYVTSLSTVSARLGYDFDRVRKKYGTWHIAGVGESHPTKWGPFRDIIVVPEGSARCENFCTAVADHITLCKPASKTSNNFQHLKQFLLRIQRKVQVETSFDNRQRTPELLVGVDNAVKEVQEMLRENQKVGIVGMGGVGKTTLAMAVFNELAPTYDYSCFFSVVKSVLGREENVKKELWGRLYCHGKKVDESYREGCWSKMKGKRLLLVLDDITSPGHDLEGDAIMASDRDLDALSDIAHDIGLGAAGPRSGSRFIVTSRDADHLNDMNAIYPVSFLVYRDAAQLFIKYAFPKQAVPPSALRTSVEAIVEKCDGLPLTLEVVGKSLKGKENKEFWDQTLKILDKADGITSRHAKLWEQLRPSYSNLGEEEQQMFLDITTFFSGVINLNLDPRVSTFKTWTLRDAKGAWRVIYGSEDVRWQTLLDRSLVYDVKEDEQIRVHEQLQSLGRKIASESKKCRIWNDTEALRLLQSTDESGDQIHALRLEPPLKVCGDPFSMDIHIARSVSRRLKVVRYLHLSEHMNVEAAQENATWVHDHLALLRCTSRQFSLLFNHIRLSCLSVLEIIPYYHVGNLEYLPSSIGQLSALRILKLSHLDLGTLPDEIGQLRALERFNIWECHSLYCLPESFGNLPSLQYLEFSNCGLHSLPESFGNLSALQHLEFSNCGLPSLPESFGSLRSLKYLKFHYCRNLHNLPESFGHLGSLENLEFKYCAKLHNLPESFGELSKLKQLQFYGLILRSLPKSFSDLFELEHLIFRGVNLRSLPESFGDLSELKHLELRQVSLRNLPESFGCLPALEHLTFQGLPHLESLPVSLGRLSGLQFLEILDCPKLNDLSECFGQLAKLQDLDIHGCRKLDRLPTSFAELKDLRHLGIAYIALTSIPDFINTLPSLKALHLGVLPYIKELPTWLTETTLSSSPAKLGRRIYHVEDGHFTLAKEEDFNRYSLSPWLHGNVEDELMALYYGEALEAWTAPSIFKLK